MRAIEKTPPSGVFVPARPSRGSSGIFLVAHRSLLRSGAFEANWRKINTPLATPRCVRTRSNTCKLNAPFIPGRSRSSRVIQYGWNHAKVFGIRPGNLRVMETRIARQTTLVEPLKGSGQDVAEATKRLELLKSVLTEMRSQLGQLVQTEAGTKRPTVVSKRPPAPKKK